MHKYSIPQGHCVNQLQHQLQLFWNMCGSGLFWDKQDKAGRHKTRRRVASPRQDNCVSPGVESFCTLTSLERLKSPEPDCLFNILLRLAPKKITEPMLPTFMGEIHWWPPDSPTKDKKSGKRTKPVFLCICDTRFLRQPFESLLSNGTGHNSVRWSKLLHKIFNYLR